MKKQTSINIQETRCISAQSTHYWSSTLNLTVFTHFTNCEKQSIIFSLTYTKPVQLQHIHRKVTDLYLKKFKYCFRVNSKTRDIFTKSFVNSAEITKKINK
jgi:hypothetical protein